MAASRDGGLGRLDTNLAHATQRQIHSADPEHEGAAHAMVADQGASLSRTIQIAVSLPAPSDRLFDMYLDPEEHAAFTGAPVTISDQPGSAFRAFDGVLTGSILQVVPKRLIVQSWRSAHWGPADLDSTLVLAFLPEGATGRIELTQVNVVDADFAGVSQGWEKFYWAPWSAYLTGE
jgi:uncharacterized protein YndB with AHSA1/START domain